MGLYQSWRRERTRADDGVLFNQWDDWGERGYNNGESSRQSVTITSYHSAAAIDVQGNLVNSEYAIPAAAKGRRSEAD
jgi:hypothetical protein